MTEADPYDLARFLQAQRPVIDQVRHELMSGRKTSHWMWFVFPQLQGLGSSPTARRYAIRSTNEARAYVVHPVLGVRLRELTAVVNGLKGCSAHDIFGSPDDIKFHSSMTLFHAVAPDEPVFQAALERFFAGRRDEASLRLLGGG